MEEKERMLEAIRYLLETKKVRNHRQISDETGIHPSTISQLPKKEKVPETVISKFLTAYPFISSRWLKYGEGPMTTTDPQPDLLGNDVIIPAKVWKVIEDQAESLRRKDAQIDEMISMIKLNAKIAAI